MSKLIIGISKNTVCKINLPYFNCSESPALCSTLNGLQRSSAKPKQAWILHASHVWDRFNKQVRSLTQFFILIWLLWKKNYRYAWWSNQRTLIAEDIVLFCSSSPALVWPNSSQPLPITIQSRSDQDQCITPESEETYWNHQTWFLSFSNQWYFSLPAVEVRKFMGGLRGTL